MHFFLQGCSSTAASICYPTWQGSKNKKNFALKTQILFEKKENPSQVCLYLITTTNPIKIIQKKYTNFMSV